MHRRLSGNYLVIAQVLPDNYKRFSYYSPMYLLRHKNAITFCLCKRAAAQQKTKLFLNKKAEGFAAERTILRLCYELIRHFRRPLN